MTGSLLLVGADSEIGAVTARHLGALGVPVVATTRRRERIAADCTYLDLAQPLNGWTPPPDVEAACIVAAVARLQTCDSDPVGSSYVNVGQTVALAETLLGQGIPVLFLSSNQVFDGSLPFVPADAPLCPVSEYGRQKARTEEALRRHIAAGAPVSILRFAKIVSPGMPLLRQWASALESGQPISAFADMMLAPTPVQLAAQAIARLMREGARGIYQLTGPRDVSYAELADHLAERLGADPRLVARVGAASAGMPKGATPRHTTLDSSALRDRFGLAVPDVWAVVEEAVGPCRPARQLDSYGRPQ
jgi:dTDP-4-dehydrorhamnose reductase